MERSQNSLRLFIAIEFPEAVKTELEKGMVPVRRACTQGSFSRRENLHLTLVFLGQTPASRVPEITAAMDACTVPAFPITIGALGQFRQREGALLWRRIWGEDSLPQLQAKLAALLREKGFSLDSRPYKPHMTMVRQAVLKEGRTLAELSATVPDISFPAEGMTLMSSELLPTGAVYTPLHRTLFHSPQEK